jgi:hypothetical protein
VKFRTSIFIALGLLGNFASQSKAANVFNTGNESLVYQTNFNSDFNANNNWYLNYTQSQVDPKDSSNSILASTLPPTVSSPFLPLFNSATYKNSPLALGTDDYNFYYSFRTNRAANEGSKLVFDINFTDKLDLNTSGQACTLNTCQEERHIALELVPKNPNTNSRFRLYLDPAFCGDPATCPPENQNQYIQDILAPSTLFSDNNIYESLKISVKKTDNNKIEFTPYYYLNNVWQSFNYLNNPSNNVSLSLDIAGDLEGQDSIKSIGFLTRKLSGRDAASIDALAITKTAKTPPSVGNGTVKTPEPTIVLGLFSAALISLQVKRKRQ